MDPRSRARRRLLCGAALGLAGVVGIGAVAAEELQGYVELTAARTDTEAEVPGIPPLSSRFDSFVQRYNVVLTRRFLPNLELLAGGFFERESTDLVTQGSGSETTVDRLRPFFNLRVRNPLHFMEVAYNRNQEDREAALQPDLRLVRETWSAMFGMSPDDLPSLKLQLFRTNVFDGGRTLSDRREDLAQLTSEYEPDPSLSLYYRGSFDDTDDRIEGIRVKGERHNGRARFARDGWNRRVMVGADYAVTHRASDTTAAPEAEVRERVLPPGLVGLSSTDDTPEIGELNPNGGLVDENLLASAGINLGVPRAGADSWPRNIGLDLTTELPTNALWVWVDRYLPPEIHRHFSWQIWSSSDEVNWTLRETIPQAPFGFSQNRFEIRYTEITVRYLKVVVRPLALADDPQAVNYPSIFVTEIEAYRYRPGSEVEGRSSSTAQRGNVSVRTRLLKEMALFYELDGFLTKADSDPANYTLSNGIALTHPLTPILSTVARVAREDGKRGSVRRETIQTYLYSASLAATPWPTLRSNLVFSGRDETIDGLPNDLRSLFLNTIAELYRGIDVNLSLGESRSREPDGRGKVTDQITAAATLLPHPSTTLNVILEDSRMRPTGGGTGEGPSEDRLARELNVSWTPIRTLYLFGSWRLEDRTGIGRRTTDNYTASWTPFQEGTLHFNVYYNEFVRSEYDAVETTFTPSIRWDITRRMYLDIAYVKIEIDSAVLRTESNTLSGTLRVSF